VRSSVPIAEAHVGDADNSDQVQALEPALWCAIQPLDRLNHKHLSRMLAESNGHVADPRFIWSDSIHRIRSERSLIHAALQPRPCGQIVSVETAQLLAGIGKMIPPLPAVMDCSYHSKR
jgi:hypothetical protein